MKETVDLTWNDVFRKLNHVSAEMSEGRVYGVPTGGMILTGLTNNATTLTLSAADFILDDIEDSGKTRKYYEERCPQAKFIPLFHINEFPGKWVTFPWEREHPAGPKTAEGNITRLIQSIGEDPSRDGLKDTPRRVIKSFQELYSGYGKDTKDIFTVFKNDGYKSMVVLKDIEMYSMCEHHMLPFYGKAHVAYIPNNGKIVGISKLARLVDIYARRLQVQERICEQVVGALMDYLAPKGAACVIEAVHMCMLMRGVGKQNSVMVTSSLRGEFIEDPAVKEEFMQLIKR